MNCKIIVSAFFFFSSLFVSAQIPAATIPEFNFLKQDKSIFINKHLEPCKRIFFIFFDTECEHCRHAIQYINQHVKEFKKAAVYLITLDSREKIALFLAKYGPQLLNINYVTVLQDPYNEFILKFKPRKYPSIFLYSAKKELMLYDDEEQNLSSFLKLVNANAKY